MNSITIAEIKRGGMIALDAALQRGTATIMKRNRVAAIVLTPMAYESLLAKALPPSAATASALDWLLQATPAEASGLDANAMAQRIDGLHADWPEK
jgi:hypothetical protein